MSSNIPSVQAPVPSVQDQVQAPVPSVQAPVPSVQAPVPSVQAPVPSVQAPVPSVQAPVPSVQVQAQDQVQVYHHTITHISSRVPAQQQCVQCGRMCCSSFVQVDRWSPGFAECKSTLVFCDDTCLNVMADDYLRDSFRDGWLDEQAVFVDQSAINEPEHQCARCGMECSGEFVMGDPSPSQILERAMAFCDVSCHSAFAREYFGTAVEMGWLDGSAAAQAAAEAETETDSDDC